MKALDWQRYMESQRRDYQKTVFTVAELANVAGSSPHVLNVELERSRVRTTSIGRFVFVSAPAPIYAFPTEGIIAPPEQALCDFVLTTRRSGLEPRSLVTFRGLDRLDLALLVRIAAHYPDTILRTIKQDILLEKAAFSTPR